MTTIADVQKAFENLKRDNDIAKNALLIDDVFQVGDEECQGFVSVFDAVLIIENREDSKMWVALSEGEFWQIVKFALNNGFYLPQKEDESES